jgi:RNA polymerase sigma-70 factor (ECF subfamily)
MAMSPADTSAGASSRRPDIVVVQAQSNVDRTLDEHAVVRAVLAGDRDAFSILVDREAASILRTCRRVLADHHEAEDVAQEAFVTAYRTLATWQGQGPFGAWLSRIAVRLALRQLQRRKAVRWLRPSPTNGIDGDVMADLRARPLDEPETLTLRAEQEAAARRAVANLDEPYREVVALRFFGDRSLEEIALLTGRPTNTVKTHLRRGLLRLREELQPGGRHG